MTDLLTDPGPPAAADAPEALIERRHTERGRDVFDTVTWERADVEIGAFRQAQVEFPTAWNDTTRKIVAQKYLRGALGTPERETSAREMIHRVCSTIARWALEQGAIAADDPDPDALYDELCWLVLHQRLAFNSPVWFNVGIHDKPMCSACFLLGVEDTLPSLLNWTVEEGLVFQGGGGAGINLSTVRSKKEQMSGGGVPSGPTSFMRGADSWAGAIRSGGTTRRAAKMVVLDIDHPDVEEFIELKTREENKIRALAKAGFDVGFDGDDLTSVQYQNANLSVRLSDAFMAAVERDEDWALTARTTGEVLERIPARALLRKVAQAAWACGDPGVQFSSTIDAWHTCPAHGPITTSNPCSEVMLVDHSACNLSSLNLLAFLDEEGGRFDADAFAHAVDVAITAMDVIVTAARYPTERIERNAHAQRPLGLGPANLGALLMACGLGYDSTAGRILAGAVQSLMCQRAYRRSAQLAARLGAYEHFASNRAAHLAVLERHADAAVRLEVGATDTLRDLPGARTIIDVLDAADWDTTLAGARDVGLRNSQVCVAAPTGTISFLLGAETTGIEPALSLVTHKNLVGGGTMTLTVPSVQRALRRLGYPTGRRDQIAAALADTGRFPVDLVDVEHRPVFSCAMGEAALTPEAHVRMVAAVQPFLSGAASKTCNLPHDATVEDVEAVYRLAHELGLKALAVYRDGSKNSQAIADAGAAPVSAEESVSIEEEIARRVDEQMQRVGPQRRKLPRQRRSTTVRMQLGGFKGYVTFGEYADGSVGEVFLQGVGKEGSTLRGVLSAWATSVSLNLQYGVPLDKLADKFAAMRFEPHGHTGDPEVRVAQSMIDYVMRKMVALYGDDALRAEFGIELAPEPADQPPPLAPAAAPPAVEPTAAKPAADGQVCSNCGSSDLVRSGTCTTCRGCGTGYGGCS